jgi:hypothetical protein
VASRYLAELENLLSLAHPELAAVHRLEYKNLFGAIAGYVNGHIFTSCGKFGVALRLPPDTLQRLFQEVDVEHLRYFPKGHIKTKYAVLPERIIEDRSWFRKLIDDSVEYALQTED